MNHVALLPQSPYWAPIKWFLNKIPNTCLNFGI